MDSAPPEEALSVIEHPDPFSRSEALLHLELLFAAATSSSSSKRRSGVNKHASGAGTGTRYLGWWREVCAVALSKRLFGVGVGARAGQCLALLRRRKGTALLLIIFVLAGYLTAHKAKYRMAPLTLLKSCFGFPGEKTHGKAQDSTADGTSALLDSSNRTGTNAASSSSRPCIFCNIPPMSDPTSPFRVVLENEDTVVFRDRSPKGVLHLLAVPRVHIKDVKALQGVEGAAMGESVKGSG